MRASRNPENHRRERAVQADTALLYGIFGLLLFGPLAFGAVEPWSIFLMEAGSAALFLLWIAKQVLEGEMKIRWNPLFLPMAVFGLLIVSQLVFRMSAYRHDTVSLALLYLSYALLCFLAGQTLIKGSQARSLALVFSLYGAAMSGFALLQGISSNGRLYWLRTPRMGGWIYGPYVNHNHYAGLMEMLVPIPLVFSLTRGARGPRKIMAGIAAALMAGTIFLSGSRGGMLAFVVQMGVLAVVVVWGQKSRKTTLALATFLVIGVGLVLWLGGSELAKRLATIHADTKTELSGGTRLDIDRDALRMFAHKPILGWGLGTFPDVYPQFRSFHTNFFINEAHNDYLQLLVEMGGLGGGAMLWLLWAVYRNGIRKLKNWPEDTNGAVALAALLGVTGILVHSLVDFNLQIPANAALFYVLCTVAAMESRFGKSRRKPVRRFSVMGEISNPDGVSEDGLSEGRPSKDRVAENQVERRGRF